MTSNKPMTGEQLDELMTIAVNMQRDSEKVSDRPAAMFAYAVQVAVLELRKVRRWLRRMRGLKLRLTQLSDGSNQPIRRMSKAYECWSTLKPQQSKLSWLM